MEKYVLALYSANKGQIEESAKIGRRFTVMDSADGELYVAILVGCSIRGQAMVDHLESLGVEYPEVAELESRVIFDLIRSLEAATSSRKVKSIEWSAGPMTVVAGAATENGWEFMIHQDQELNNTRWNARIPVHVPDTSELTLGEMVDVEVTVRRR